MAIQLRQGSEVRVRRAATIMTAVLAGLAVAGCPNDRPGEGARAPEAGPAPVATEGAPPAAQARAKAAAQALGQRLTGRLQEALKEGPVAAIAVCQDEAPGLTAEVAQAQGVRLGRTGVRLRNQGNAPPEWAAPLVERRVEQPAFLTTPAGETRALLPIHMKPLCATCHGPEEQLAPEVRAALAKRYPEDRATGFGPEELRGWFWVEVPPPEAEGE